MLIDFCVLLSGLTRIARFLKEDNIKLLTNERYMIIHIVMIFFLFVAILMLVVGWVWDTDVLALSICFTFFDLLSVACLTKIMILVNGKGHNTHLALTNYRTKKVVMIHTGSLDCLHNITI